MSKKVKDIHCQKCIKETPNFIITEATPKELKYHEQDFMTYIDSANKTKDNFSNLVVGISLGVLSGLMASIIDNVVKESLLIYPIWYIILITILFLLIVFLTLRIFKESSNKIRVNKYKLEEVRKAIRGEKTILGFATVHEKKENKVQKFTKALRDEPIYHLKR